MEGLDASSIVPLYKQLKDLILKEIKEGKLKTNQKIPTEQELSEKYQISRMTVRKALAQLVDEEVLAKKQGKGTFVQEPKIVEDLDNANSFTNLCKRNGKIPGGNPALYGKTSGASRSYGVGTGEWIPGRHFHPKAY